MNVAMLRQRVSRLSRFLSTDKRDSAANTAHSLESGHAFSAETKTGRRNRTTLTIVGGAALLIGACLYFLYARTAHILMPDEAAAFLHSASRLRTEPMPDGSTWFASARVEDAWLQTMPIDRIFEKHAQHIVRHKLPCVAPILYGRNIRLLSIDTDRHFINPSLIDAAAARAWYMEQQSSVFDRVPLLFDSMQSRSELVSNQLPPDFPIFARARARALSTRRNEHVWMNATEWPSYQQVVVELTGNVSYCVQTMIYWFQNGALAPFSKKSYSDAAE